MRIPLLLLLVTFAATAQQVLAPAPNNQFAGNNICESCHADVWMNFYKNPHYKSMASGKLPESKTGCEGCHGGARKHVENLGGKDTIPHAFSLMTPNQTLETCLTCHAADLEKANIHRSEHTNNGVACTSCHS